MSFQQPKQGTRVLFARGKNMPFTTAFCIKSNASGIGVVTYLPQGGARHYSTCWHIDDPWLLDPNNLNTLNEDEDMGVYTLHPDDIALDNRMSALEARMAALEGGDEAPRAVVKRKRELAAA